jgi:hypothetical protein
VPPAAPPPGFTTGLRILLGTFGALSFGAGVLAVFVTQNGTGSAVLLAFGGGVLVLALLGGRIESLEFGGARLRLRAAAAERYALADESERRGDTEAADRLREQARAMLEAAARPIAVEYRSVRGSMPSGTDRTHAMEEVLERARRLAEEQTFDPAEVARWLRGGGEEERITALAMMQARPELRDYDAIRSAIKYPRSAFEQYHAMRTALEMVDDLEPGQRTRLAETVRGVRNPRFRRDSGRMRLGDEILRRTGPRPAEERAPGDPG